LPAIYKHWFPSCFLFTQLHKVDREAWPWTFCGRSTIR